MDKKDIKVLYVDDEPIPRLIFQKSFESKYSILVADSGATALEMIETLDDTELIIISDMTMPVMDGVELIGIVKESHPNTPCFILSSMGGGEAIESALASGQVTQAFEKPLNVAAIDAAIDAVMN